GREHHRPSRHDGDADRGAEHRHCSCNNDRCRPPGARDQHAATSDHAPGGAAVRRQPSAIHLGQLARQIRAARKAALCRAPRRRRGLPALPRRAVPRRAAHLGVRGRPHRRRAAVLGLGSGRRRQGEQAVRDARQRSEAGQRADRHLLLRRRLRGFAHAGAEALGSAVQQRLRLQGRLPGLGEARRRRTQGTEPMTEVPREDRGGSAPPSSLIPPPSSLLTSDWLTIRVQLALGVIFVAAALPKLVDPPSFAHMIYNYRLVPAPLVNLMGLTMPWIELLCGLALILGICRTTARTLIALMLLTFILAISINLARGNSIDCGCFDVSAAGKTTAERLADMKFVIVRDLGMLLMVAQMWWAERRRRGARIDEVNDR